MKRFLISITYLLVALAAVNAEPRTREQVMEAALRVLNGGTLPGMHRAPAAAEAKVLAHEGPLIVVGYDKGSYAIVTDDDLLPEVLGYSASSFSDDNLNDGFRWWWRTAKASAQELIDNGTPARRVVPNSRYKREVPQMISAAWGQQEPYNNMCPLVYDFSGDVIGRTYVGCVATACTQIMYYHRYPLQGTGTYVDVQTTDIFGNPRPIKVTLEDYTYDYSLMRDTYTKGNYDAQEADEVAKLSYTVGVTFAMIYGMDGSGTFLDSAAVSLKKHFGFKNASYVSRSYSDTNSWMDRIFNELSNGRPVAYGGADDIYTIGGGGHCFVFDGYDASGLVHVNWGWNGINDGYYDVGILNPANHYFKNQQDMIIGIAPPKPEDAVESVPLSKALTLSDFESMVNESVEHGLRNVDLTDCTLEDGILPTGAFAGSMLQSISLPANLRVISDGAFANCKQLASVTFPESSAVQEFLVEDNVIYTADGSEVIEVLPYYHNNTEVIGGYTSLLMLRDGVKAVHPHAFDGCFRVKGIAIPASVQSIGAGAFSNATNLKRIWVKNRMPADVAMGAFGRIDVGYTQLAIPAGTSEIYRRSGEWAQFFRLDNVVEKGTCIKARYAFREVGESNPVFTYQMFGDYVMGEPVLRCDADESSPAGEYQIVVEMGTLSGDDIYLENGVLKVFDTTGITGISAEGKASAAYNLSGQKANRRDVVIVRKGKKVTKLSHHVK